MALAASGSPLAKGIVRIRVEDDHAVGVFSHFFSLNSSPPSSSFFTLPAVWKGLHE